MGANPTKCAYIENFFSEELYEELHKTYPEFNKSWKSEDSYDKCAYRKYWGKIGKDVNLIQEEDNNYSPAWNKLVKYFHTREKSDLSSKNRLFAGFQFYTLFKKFFKYLFCVIIIIF